MTIRISLFSLLFVFLLIYACASIGSPTGGLDDIDPPKFVKSNPAPNAIEFKKNKIELTFDEFIGIEKPSEKVIITPPQQKLPIIKALGKKITVELKDSLIANTTYTFDFTNGIIDNNANNAIEGFSFAFSTGSVVDSMMVGGILLNAANLEPTPNMVVGLHSNLEDSAFTNILFSRTSVTNDRGQFQIRNVAPGTYRLYALNDLNHDYKFSQATEAIAFYDSLIVPAFEPAVRYDTIMIDSLTIGEIKEVPYNRFTPDDIVLSLFTEIYESQYLSKSERPANNQIIFNFSSDKGLPPDIQLLDENENETDNDDWYIREFSPDKTKITYWISDSTVYKQDTIKIKAEYWVSDSLLNLVPKTDTIRLAWKDKTAKKKKKDEVKPIEFLTFDISARNGMDVFDTLKIVFSEPVPEFDFSQIHIQQLVDSLWEDRIFPIVMDSLNPRKLYIDTLWTYSEEFQLSIDSAAIHSVYGKWNNKINYKFKFNKEEDYGKLFVAITGNEFSGFGQLLDASEKILRTSLIQDGELIFEDLKPGKYYLRYIDDANENGVWDTGNYKEKRQPEKVYYYNGAFEMKKFLELEEPWNIKETPVEKQKPIEITKNKPVVKKPKTAQQQRNANQKNSGNQSRNATQGNPNRSLQNMPLR